MRSSEYKREKEAAVYAAVLRLIEEGCDLSHVTVQQIAQAAGIGKGTVYEYFASKEEILGRTSLYCLSGEVTRLEQALQGCPTLAEMENRLVAHLQELCERRVASYRILVRALGSDHSAACGVGRGWAQPLRDRLRRSVGCCMRRLQQAGEIDPTLSMSYCAHVLMAAATLCVLGLAAPAGAPVLEPAALACNTRQMIDRALRPGRDGPAAC